MEQAWWHGKTVYQIYPKSFYDANGDGIGDLQGIVQKLDYLKELGIGLLWLSPIYLSPLADQGYDISDYYRIDPRFGTMKDFDTLLSEAKKRDIGIVMDLVVNHCSDEHEWFQKACQNPDGPYGKYFYLEPYDGSHLPCNWRSYFGGSVWEPLPGHPELVYFHSFHKKQPDLNWENPALRKEIYHMMNWWLDKGLAGFRIDAIINIQKVLPFRDFPPDRADGLCSLDEVLTHAHGVQQRLQEMRKQTLAPHHAFSVGEVFDCDSRHVESWIGTNGCFASLFDFTTTLCGLSPKGWYASKPVISGEEYKRCCFSSQQAVPKTCFLSNIIENHDGPRGVSRYLPEGQRTEVAKKMLGGLNMMLRGLPFLFQGQEIGMENQSLADIAQIDDVSTKDEYRVARQAGLSPSQALAAVAPFSRDNARTPMQWTDGPNAGFTRGKPWLPANPNYREINVQQQAGRKDSILAFYRRLIALRSNPCYADAIVEGSLVPWLPKQKNLMAYFRKGNSKTLLVMGNYQQAPQRAKLPGPARVILDNDLPVQLQNKEILLAGYQFVVLEILP